MLAPGEITAAIEKHKAEPHLRYLQGLLAKEVTIMVHGETEYNKSVDASQILFGKGTRDMLEKMDEATFLNVFEGVPAFQISRQELSAGIPVLDLLAVNTQIFPSKGEARKMLQQGAVFFNKEKAENEQLIINDSFLLSNKYILVQKGKKNYYLIKVD